MRAGDTFTFLDTTIDNHLWVVISDPLLDVADPVVIVNLTTYRKGSDPTCILQPEDHRFIRHPTAVYYRGALDVSNSSLETRVNEASLVLQGPVSPGVLELIRQGISRSPDPPPEECREILRKQGLIE